jgi:allantoate deiminase/N-carbamoyl-L-amino-acid hydrolase
MSSTVIPLATLNALPAERFVDALGAVFEHSPWVPERVAAQRPFASCLALHEAMCAAVAQAGADRQLALIRAHPELAGRAALRRELTAESTREQRGAGLDRCSAEELARLQALNAAYTARFGFPFVLAIKGHTRTSVIAEFERRLGNDADRERAVALNEIGRIAGFRLADLVEEPYGAQIVDWAQRLARHTDRPPGLSCPYLGPAHRATAAQIRDWMLAAGLDVATDAVGNVIGRLYAENPDAGLLITGSHYDTVIDAGAFDGRLGILLPIAVAGRLRRQGVQLPYTLEVVAFAEEEGVRFGSTFLGSSAVAGRFDPALLELRDAEGITMREAMCGAGLDPAAIPAAARDPLRLLGFVEVHIEQGPVLLNENQPLGVVTAIAGGRRSLLTVSGEAGHSGTVPMGLRRDAAAAAAEIVLAVERLCSGTPGLVGTVGRLEVPGGAINTIAGRCELSLDIRAGDDAIRDRAHAQVLAEIQRIAGRRRVEVAVRPVLEAAATPCAPALQRAIARSVERVTGSTHARSLPSGAGHDAMMMAAIAPVGMLFVRCGNGGISHNPAETMSADDAELAARVFADFLQNFDAT